MRIGWVKKHHMNESALISLTVPCGNVLKHGESSRAPILTVAPPSPTTTYSFLEAAGAEETCGEGTKEERQKRKGKEREGGGKT